MSFGVAVEDRNMRFILADCETHSYQFFDDQAGQLGPEIRETLFCVTDTHRFVRVKRKLPEAKAVVLVKELNRLSTAAALVAICEVNFSHRDALRSSCFTQSDRNAV